jgi:transcriptional regulator with XRE-family HTH domain
MPNKPGAILDVAKIRKLRLERGLTLKQASKLIGVSGPARWSDIESGRKANITMDLLRRIAAALKVDPSELLASDSSTKRPRKR